MAPWHPARRWTRTGNKWSVSLTPPAGIGIAVTQVEVTDGGQTVFLLGYLLFRVGGGVLSCLLLTVCDASCLALPSRPRASPQLGHLLASQAGTVLIALSEAARL